MTVGRRTLLSRSHVSSMTGGCTCPIYYQGDVRVAKGSVIIRSKLPELIKNVSRAGNCSPADMFQACIGGGSNLLSRNYVSSTTGECTCPIEYQGVFSVAKGSVIIRSKLPELIKNVSWAGNRLLSCSNVPSMPRWWVEPALPQPCFQHDRELLVPKKEVC